jgi:UPF0716 protein FxsA
MLLRLFLLFTVVPLAELWLLIRIGGLIGVPATLGLVLFTGAAGAALARREGLRSWLAVQGELAQGRMPGVELVHGLFILLAGILLITPGVMTDVTGLLLLVRPIRRVLIGRLRHRFEQQLEAGAAGFVGGPGVGVFWGTAGAPGGPAHRGGAGGIDRAPEERPAGYPRGREIIVDRPEDERD